MAVAKNTNGAVWMRYLELILEDAMVQGGFIKATGKGNLPAKLVKQATELLPEFAVARCETEPSICEDHCPLVTL